MENLKMTALADGKTIYAPQLVDLSETGCLDELEHAVWNLFLKYAKYFGINCQNESEPDWATVKAIQETVLKQFEDAGVLFDHVGIDKKFLEEIKKHCLSEEDMTYILSDSIIPSAVKKLKWEKLIATTPLECDLDFARSILNSCGVVLYAILPSGKALMLYDFDFAKERGIVVLEYPSYKMNRNKECKNETQNESFFFTFGSNEVYPYKGGWVEVYAKDKREASEKFRYRYPDRKNGLLNCANVYSEKEFLKTCMGIGGNRGYFCHDIIL